MGQPYGDRLLSLVMLNVLDEKWKDHLYDLDQLRNAIHYRSWGQKDPLVEYKQEAYTMFVDLMNDIYNTFSERFLKVQLVLEPPAPPPLPMRPERPTKRYNALGILEDIPAEEPTAEETVLDVGPAETPTPKPVTARKDPTIVGAGRLRSLDGNGTPPPGTDWSTVGRNDPCPCGSGKKFKKCHGVNL
jgi:preprotein translocase subunit SecA